MRPVVECSIFDLSQSRGQSFWLTAYLFPVRVTFWPVKPSYDIPGISEAGLLREGDYLNSNIRTIQQQQHTTNTRGLLLLLVLPLDVLFFFSSCTRSDSAQTGREKHFKGFARDGARISRYSSYLHGTSLHGIGV